jgi:tetratricopeptide (TPR) repeat protein
MTKALLLAGVVIATLTVAAQLRVTSPYLDVVERYRSGDHLRAVEEVIGFPISGVRERARRDLNGLPCQLLTGLADCAKARQQKPLEFARVIDVWTATLPAAAALHAEAGITAQKTGRLDAAAVHHRLALELSDMLVALVPATVAGLAERAAVRRQVWLLSIWLLQLRLDLKELEMLLLKARQAFPGDALVLLASGAYHEVQARPYLLLEASEGRQGNLAAWRREERTWRLKNAADGYREAITVDATLAEARLRLGRVLALEGRLDEAHIELARAAELTSDARWRYLASLFRAAAYEAGGKADAAQPAYRAALELWPASQAARMGLSRSHAERGDWAEARRELDGLPPPGTELADRADPWWAYDFGQAWRLESGIVELRRLVPR